MVKEKAPYISTKPSQKKIKNLKLYPNLPLKQQNLIMKYIYSFIGMVSMQIGTILLILYLINSLLIPKLASLKAADKSESKINVDELIDKLEEEEED